MVISERLTRIGSYVPRGSVVADIGTDHALLPIYLVLEGICPRAIACDLYEGPLDVAQANVNLYKLTQSIELRQGDGLEPLQPGEADVIVISGMGGAKIKEILDNSPVVLDKVSHLILQPQRGAGSVRRWLFQHNWLIIDEDLVLEKDQFYEIVVAKQSPANWPGNEIEDDVLFDIGPLLIEKKHPLLIPFLEDKLRTAKNVLKSLRRARTPAAKRMRQEWLRKIDVVRRVIEDVS